MSTQTETRNGRCPTHGEIEASRDMPKMAFPFVVFAVRRAMARRRPFVCPECGAEVETGQS